MKRTSIFPKLLLVLCAIVLCGCDSKKGKVKELASQFVVAYNDGDKAAIYEILPAIKTCENLSISGSIGKGDDINIAKDDSTGNYIATINEQKQQRLVFAVDSVGGVQMIDTYGVFHLDSIANELALKLGVPIKKISDMNLSKLMNPESDFLKDIIQTKGTNYLWANYGSYSWGRTYSSFETSMNFTISNHSKQTISGKDYYLFITPKQNSTGRTFASKTVDGVDIAPNEVREFKVSEPYLYNYASQRDLSYTVEVKYRSESIISLLLNYGQFEGNEYNDYIAHPFRARVTASGQQGVVSAEKKGVAYAYKEMSDKSQVVDTLYHREPVTYTWEEADWVSIYSPDYHLIGYLKMENLDMENKTTALNLVEIKLKSPDGKIKVFDDNKDAPKDKVVKTYSTGQKVLLEYRFADNDSYCLVYERQLDGSMEKIGRIDSDNIDYDSVEWPD